MADNPRLTIELVDRGGTASPSYPGGTSGSGAPTPYDPSKDIQQRITEQGIPVPASPSPVTDINPAPVTEAAAPVDPMVNLVKSILDQDKNVTPSELAKLLEIKESAARDYIQRASPQPTSTGQAPAAPNQPAPDSPQQPPVTSLDRFVDRVKDNILTNEEKYNQYVGQLDKALGEGKLSQEEYNKALGIGRPISELETLAQRIRESQITPEERFNQTQQRVSQAVDRGLLSSEAATRYLNEQQSRLPGNRVADDGGGIDITQVTSAISNLSIASGFSQTTAGGVLQAGLNAAPALMGAGSAGPIVAAIAAAVIAGKAGLETSVDTIFGAADRAVDVSRNLSPDVAMAEATSELRRFQADLRSAEVLGPAAARYMNERSIIDSSSQGIIDKLSQPIVEKLSTTMESVSAVVAGINRFLEEPAVQQAIQLFSDSFGDSGITQAYNLLPESVRNYFEEARKRAEKADSPYTWFDNEYPHLPLPPPFSEMETDKTLRKGTFEIAPIPGLRL